MSGEALATRRRIIPRPRLTRLLDESPARIKLLVAPAGYGKTTLAQQWLAERGRRDVWYRGGSASADVAALAAGISIAAAEIVPDAGKRMRQRLRAASHPEGDVEVLADLLAEDAQDWPKDSWICVDDYQYAMEAPAPERFIELLIQSTPIRMVVTSRRRPTWATARRILYGELQELDRRTLAMEPEEGKIVIGRVDGDVAALLAQARGWPAVIGLASTARHIAPPQEGLPPALYDYFAEELYQQLDSALQAALCRLCVAPVITAELRHLLLGDGEAEAIETALRLGVVEEQRGRFEMHPLIRSFLEAKLAAAGQIDSLTLARRVIDHLIARGSWDEAFDVVARFQVHDRLEPLIAAAVEEIIESGRLTTLSQWLEFAARHHLEAPVLDFAEAELAFRHGLYGTAAVLAAGAAHAAAQASKYEPPLLTRMHLRAGQSALLDSREADALRHFQQAGRVAPDGSLSREALIGQFFSAVDLGLDEAERLLTALEGISTRGPEDLVRLSIARMLYAERTGGLADVIARARDVYPLLERTSDPVIRTSFLNSYGQSLVLMAWYERALRVAEETERAAGDFRLQFVFSHAAILRAMASIGLRDVSTALRAITDAEQSSDDPHITAVAAILRARVALLRGDPDEALSILSTPLHRRPSDAMYSEYLASRALVSAVVGDTASVVGLCEEVLAAPKFARGGATTARLLRSIAADERAEADPKAMKAALDFVFEGGRLDEFVTVYRSFPELLQFALTASAYHEVTTAIIRRSNDGRMARTLGLSVKGPMAGPLGRLTPREREVLALVTQGLTNKGIAGRLVISEPTVKVHVRHALEKLGATTRAEAAAKFAQLPQATEATANGPSSA